MYIYEDSVATEIKALLRLIYTTLIFGTYQHQLCIRIQTLFLCRTGLIVSGCMRACARTIKIGENNLWECIRCGLCLPDRVKVNHHFGEQHLDAEGGAICSVCDLFLPNLKSLNDHIAVKHSKIKRIKT